MPLLALLALRQAQAIDCRKAAHAAEVAVCMNPDLRLQDDHLNRLYQVLKSSVSPSGALDAEQKQWIQSQRNACTQADCLQQAYAKRLKELQHALGPACLAWRPSIAGAWQQVGDNGPFEQFSAGQDARFDSWLHNRPEISGGRWRLEGCRFMVSGPADMRIELVLIGANASELRFLEPGVAGIGRYRRIGR